MWKKNIIAYIIGFLYRSITSDFRNAEWDHVRHVCGTSGFSAAVVIAAHIVAPSVPSRAGTILWRSSKIAL